MTSVVTSAAVFVGMRKQAGWGWLAADIPKGVQICHARNLGQVDEICSISVMAATMYGRIHNFNTADRRHYRHAACAGQAELLTDAIRSS